MIEVRKFHPPCQERYKEQPVLIKAAFNILKLLQTIPIKTPNNTGVYWN
jgi:hypothetical protein